MVVLDTSAILASMDSKDDMHDAVVKLMQNENHLILPASVLSEITFMVQQRFGQRYLARFIDSVADGDVAIDWRFEDIERIRFLVERYADLPLGFADAAVIACAERHGGRVATLDHRHFGVVAREGTIQIVP